MKIILVIPCYNEERVLEKNINLTLAALNALKRDIVFVISDNNSKDRTVEIGKRLAEENKNIEYSFVGQPGKGAAVLSCWQKYDADVYGFMDADLATDLRALEPALNFMEDGYDIVAGSRRIKGSVVKRELYRKVTSSILNFIIRFLLKTKIKDTPCGFKFVNKKVFTDIVPKIQDRSWVFDTELLILAERAGYKIKELPVIWEEKAERGSKVNIYPTAIGYLREIWKMRGRLG